RLALEHYASEQKVRGRAPDVDPDGAQRDGVLLPDGAGDSVAFLLGEVVVFVLELEIVHAAYVAGPIDCGVRMTPVSTSGGSARMAGSSKTSPICEATPVARMASSHLRWMRGS